MSGWTLITVEEFEANAEAIFDRVEAGEQFNVSRNGVVTMTVVPKTDQGDVNIDDYAAEAQISRAMVLN